MAGVAVSDDFDVMRFLHFFISLNCQRDIRWTHLRGTVFIVVCFFLFRFFGLSRRSPVAPHLRTAARGVFEGVSKGTPELMAQSRGEGGEGVGWGLPGFFTGFSVAVGSVPRGPRSSPVAAPRWTVRNRPIRTDGCGRRRATDQSATPEMTSSTKVTPAPRKKSR